MQLAPFLLEHWLEQSFDGSVKYDLASSTGPHWSVQDLTELMNSGEREGLSRTELIYSPAQGSEQLREAVAQFYGVLPQNVQIATGASEALLILLFGAAEQNANVILPQPVYPPVLEIARSFGIETRFYKLKRENHFAIDVQEVQRLADRNTKFIFVNTPHNPLGSVAREEDLRALHDFAAERKIQFVVDEVYHPLYHGVSMSSAASFPHATVLGDTSKALCLSGLRVGWIVEHDQRRQKQYQDARAYFTIGNSSICEYLATVALRHASTIVARAQKVTTENLAALDRFFAEHKQQVDWIRPEGGTTAFPWLVSGQNARAFCEKALKQGVLLAPGDCFGNPEHFRLGFGACASDFNNALELISDVLAGSKSDAAIARVSAVQGANK